MTSHPTRWVTTTATIDGDAFIFGTKMPNPTPPSCEQGWRLISSVMIQRTTAWTVLFFWEFWSGDPPGQSR